MSPPEESQTSQSTAPAVSSPTGEQLGQSAGADSVNVQVPEFEDLQRTPGSEQAVPLSRFYEVKVTVTAELGRITIPIKDLLCLGEGSVIELNRSVNAPVEIMAQGVPLAKGKVVVIDDCFAIRINEIEKDAEKKMS